MSDSITKHTTTHLTWKVQITIPENIVDLVCKIYRMCGVVTAVIVLRHIYPDAFGLREARDLVEALALAASEDTQ